MPNFAIIFEVMNPMNRAKKNTGMLRINDNLTNSISEVTRLIKISRTMKKYLNTNIKSFVGC